MLRLVILQLLALVILAAVPSQIHLHEVAKIKTDGAAGFEHFTEGQSHFLVVPNFWDGIDRNMGADTKVYFPLLAQIVPHLQRSRCYKKQFVLQQKI